MAVTINTNLDSIKIRADLSNATIKMATAMERMSTGLKINSAKDDAAGAVISARMQVQLNGNKIAQNNVQNGNAMLSTAEGNIDIVLDNVSRIRDLTLQAKNGTYSKEEIQAMQDEVAQRIQEIDRVSKSSKYSQLNLFGSEELKDGTYFQVGANSSKDNIIQADASIFESVEFKEITGLKAIEHEARVIGGDNADTKNDLDTSKYTAEEKITVANADGKRYNVVASNKVNETEGCFYAYTVDGNGEGVGAWYVQDNAGTVAADTVLYKANNGPEYLDLSLLNATGTEETGKHTKTFSGALDKLDAAIDNLTARKSQIGSAQNRLDSALEGLTTQFENLSSAKSIITDSDIATESSDFTRQQILQQVSTSLLAQANQAPSIALSLV